MNRGSLTFISAESKDENEDISLSYSFKPTVRVIRGNADEILKLIVDSAARASSDRIAPDSNIVADRFGPAATIKVLGPVKELMRRNPKYQIRYITDIQPENIAPVRELMNAGYQLRHIEGIRPNFGVTRREYLNYYASLEKGYAGELIISDNPELVGEMQNVFSMLWESGIPANVRINQIEERIDIGETRLILGTKEIYDTSLKLALAAEEEVLMALIAPKSVLRKTAFWEDIAKLSRPKTRFRLLLPNILDKERSGIEEMFGRRFEWKEVEPTGMGFAIYDRIKAVIIQYGGDDSTQEVVASGVLTTNRQTVLGLVQMFDGLWRQSEIVERESKLRAREERVAGEARLLQDILTHDIRNYQQVIRLSGEYIGQELRGNQNLSPVLTNMLQAIEGSNELLQKAIKLGQVLADHDPILYPLGLVDSIESSLELVKKAYPEKHLFVNDFAAESREKKATVNVFADELLDEVFANLLSNSVKYTEDSNVRLTIKVDERMLPQNGGEARPSYWRILITDLGRGIPDELKANIFGRRYMKNARGTGLGMSIVHALVVGRYNGRVSISDRVPGDHAKGTIIEVWLPK
ncbi:MAG: sensor histidine kinase [Nitrososphaerales archaeon]